MQVKRSYRQIRSRMHFNQLFSNTFNPFSPGHSGLLHYQHVVLTSTTFAVVVVDYVNKLFPAINNFFIRLPKDEIIHKVNFECISFERVPYFILYTGLTCSLNFLNLTFALFLLPSVSRDLPRYVHRSCTIISQPIL